MQTIFQVHRPPRLMWQSGPCATVPLKEGLLVHAGLQPRQTLQHPLQQRAPPAAFALRCHLQRIASWEHDVHLHTPELVADDLSLHTGQTFHKVYGKREKKLGESVILPHECAGCSSAYLKARWNARLVNIWHYFSLRWSNSAASYIFLNAKPVCEFVTLI